MIKIHYQNNNNFVEVPSKQKFVQWIKLAFGKQKAEITVRLVDEKESAALNQQYRHKNGPTNVLSFYYSSQQQDIVLGDLIFCVPVILHEAEEQQKQIEHHWAHLSIHGTLHLLGYDHQNDEEAEEMETLEIELLKQLGIANPYAFDSKR